MNIKERLKLKVVDTKFGFATNSSSYTTINGYTVTDGTDGKISFNTYIEHYDVKIPVLNQDGKVLNLDININDNPYENESIDIVGIKINDRIKDYLDMNATFADGMIKINNDQNGIHKVNKLIIEEAFNNSFNEYTSLTHEPHADGIQPYRLKNTFDKADIREHEFRLKYYGPTMKTIYMLTHVLGEKYASGNHIGRIVSDIKNAHRSEVIDNKPEYIQKLKEVITYDKSDRYRVKVDMPKREQIELMHELLPDSIIKGDVVTSYTMLQEYLEKYQDCTSFEDVALTNDKELESLIDELIAKPNVFDVDYKQDPLDYVIYHETGSDYLIVSRALLYNN